jgi:hypothetical protein
MKREKKKKKKKKENLIFVIFFVFVSIESMSRRAQKYNIKERLPREPL